jgi:uncharacterized membrane protein YdjX (TVP38/TMEM64 family)
MNAEPQAGQQTKRRWFAYAYLFLIIAVIVLAVIFLVKRYPNLLAIFLDQHKIRAFITKFGIRAPLILIGLQVFQIIVAPIPGHIIGFVGGYLFGAWYGILYCMIGVILGATITFWIGRIFGRGLLQMFISHENMNRFDRYVLMKGPFIIFVLLLIPVTPLGDILFYLSGLTAMPFFIFLIMAVIARTPSNVINNFIGAKASTFSAQEWIIFLVVIAVFVLLFYFNRKQIEKIILRFVKLSD